MADHLPDTANTGLPEELIGRLLDGSIDEAALDRLIALLRSDPAALDTFREQLRITELISRNLNPTRSSEAFLTAVDFRLAHSGKDQPDLFVKQVNRRLLLNRLLRWPQLRMQGIAAMAAMFIVAFVFTWLTPRHPRLPGSVANISVVRGVKYSNIPIQQNHPIPTGRTVRFDAGLLRLDFNNGAVVSIEGPAEFAVRDALVLELNRGRINAYCPPPAHGFSVVTKTARLIDRGTSFGVDASDPDASKMLVFDGAVDVASKSSPDQSEHVSTGEAFTIAGKQSPVSTHFDPKSYSVVWPVTSGIITIQGNIEPPDPDVPLRLGRFEKDDTLLVIPEKRGVIPPPEIRANTLPTDGVIKATYKQPTEPFRTTHPLRSFFFYYNPVDQPRFEGFRHFQGSITFDAPIHAVIYGSAELKATDALFQHQPLKYPNPEMRGLEDNGGEAPPDRLHLSPDRRSLFLDIYSGPHSDQLRVILDDDAPAP